jgi:hypothetical protein
MGIQVNCYVTGIAASMAFLTLTECSKRYMLDTSFLLWHGVRTGTNEPITADLAGKLAEDLKRFDELGIDMLESSLSLSTEKIMHHFHNETLWSGYSLERADAQFAELHKSFPEVAANLIKFKYKTQSMSMAELLFGRIILVAPASLGGID